MLSGQLRGPCTHVKHIELAATAANKTLDANRPSRGLLGLAAHAVTARLLGLAAHAVTARLLGLMNIVSGSFPKNSWRNFMYRVSRECFAFFTLSQLLGVARVAATAPPLATLLLERIGACLASLEPQLFATSPLPACAAYRVRPVVAISSRMPCTTTIPAE